MAPGTMLLFEYKLREDADLAELKKIVSRMYELAGRSEFGFRGGRQFRGDDGSSLTIYEFDDAEGINRFRQDPEHVAAQQQGSEFFEWLRTTVCVVERHRDVIGSAS